MNVATAQVPFAFAGAVAAVVLFVVGLNVPPFTREDGPVETIGAIFFAASSAVAAYWLVARVTLAPADRFLLVFMVPFAALLALSEISFGARMGIVTPPEMYGGGEFDGGHDIVILTLRLLRDRPDLALLAVPATVALCAVAAHLLWRHRAAVLRFADRHLSAFSVRLGVVLLMLAAALVLDLIPSYKAGVLEETLEFVAAGLMLGAVSSAAQREPARRAADAGRAHR